MFEVLGLSALEESVYHALIRTHAGTTGELAAETSTSPSRVSHALRRLSRLGLVRKSGRGPYIATRPDAAFEALFHRQEEALDQARQGLGALVEEYQLSSFAAHPANLIEVITGEAEVARYALDMHLRPKESVMLFDTPPYTSPPNDHDEVALLEPQLPTTSWRTIYSSDALALPGRFAVVSRLAELGEESRVIPSLPMKLQIVNEETAMIPLTTTERAADSMAVVHKSGLLDALVALFDAYWELATPLPVAGTSPAGPDTGVPEDDLRVLAMLATGLTDTAIAKQLKVSIRTGRRRIARALAIAGGRSRFQAGVNAKRKGLV